MTNQCISSGLPAPLYYYDMSGYWVVFRKDIYNEEYLSELGLNERQLDALLFFKSKGEIVSSEYQKKFDIAERTARYDLTELVEKKIVNQTRGQESNKVHFRR